MHNMKKLIISVFIFTFGFATATHAQEVNKLLTKKLPEAPGKEIEVITVNYAPGAVDVIHRHNAHTVVYVLDGEVEMQVRGGTLRRLGPGQVFYESPEDVHTVSRNASKTKPAKFVVFFLTKMKEYRSTERVGTYEFKSRATQREWDRDCPSVLTVCARSFLSIRCG